MFLSKEKFEKAILDVKCAFLLMLIEATSV